jgi:predicted Zn-ribbon and HTH transcriptional regulator
MTERSESVRTALCETLRRGPATLRDLSAAVGIGEKEVAEHMPHIEKSARHDGERLEVTAPVCHKCGFTFEGRGRAKTPSRCPSCKSERIKPPCFELVAVRAPTRD